MIALSQPPAGDEVLDAMAEVMERQARVNRAEASLAGARQRLGESVGRFSRVASNRGVEVPPLVAAVIQHNEGLASPAERNATPGEHTATLRDRIVAVLQTRARSKSSRPRSSPARWGPAIAIRSETACSCSPARAGSASSTPPGSTRPATGRRRRE